MRKLFALTLIALLALGMSMSLVSCGAKQEAAHEETHAETPPPPVEEMMPDTTAVDTTTSH